MNKLVKAVLVVALLAFSMYGVMSIPLDSVHLIIVENSFPVYGSPMTDLSYNITLAAVRVRSPLFRVQQKSEVRENTQSANKLLLFAQTIQGLNINVLRVTTIVDDAGHLLLNRTVSVRDLNDKRVDVYVNFNEIVGNLTVTHRLYFSLTYNYQESNFTFVRNFVWVKSLDPTTLGNENNVTLSIMEAE